jgi:YHS domain-containing protein
LKLSLHGDPLNRIARQILELILVGGIVSLLRVAQFAVEKRAAAVSTSAIRALPLHRDPFCGIHVSPEISFQAAHQGQVAHFCSAECREKYLRSGPQLSGA